MKILVDLDTLKDEKAPLYNKYPGQTNPQPAYIELDCEEETVDTDWNGEIGNAVPMRVWHGHVRRYGISQYIKGAALADLLESKEFQDLLQRVVDGYESVWDGNNHVAKLNDDARAAEEEIETLLETDEEDMTEMWDVNDWLWQNCSLKDVWKKDQSLAQAVEELTTAIEHNQYVDGDIEDALVEQAAHLFEHAPNDLSRNHVNELLERNKIAKEEAGEWIEEYGPRIDFPVYIAIPHQMPAERWYPNDEPLGEYDKYIAGDHDLHSILRIDDLEELRDVAQNYKGHQELRVRAIAEEVLRG